MRFAKRFSDYNRFIFAACGVVNPGQVQVSIVIDETFSALSFTLADPEFRGRQGIE